MRRTEGSLPSAPHTRCSTLAQFLHALLARDRLPRALTAAGVRAGPLAADGQAATVAHATVAADLAEAAHVLGDLPAKRTLDEDAAIDDRHDAGDLFLGQRVGALLGVDVRLFDDVHRVGRADPVDVAKADLDLLLRGNVDTADTGHVVL